MINDDKQQSDQKRKPILVQHNHRHHDEEMKMQLDTSSGQMH